MYGAVFLGGEGYRNDATSGVAVGDEPQSMYMVVDGTHYNDLCCFDCEIAHNSIVFASLVCTQLASYP